MSQGNKIITLRERNIATPAELSREQIDLMKRTYCAGATDLEFELFVGICKRTGLDPFARQICMVRRYSSKEEREVATVQITVDGLRLIAARTGDLAGHTEHYWCGPDGNWKDVWLEDTPPSAAKAGVKRKGFDEPVWAVARWKSYAQTYYDKGAKAQVLTAMWRDKDDVMLSKCAESLALRRAFPNDLAGLYSMEETQDQGFVIDPNYRDVDAIEGTIEPQANDPSAQSRPLQVSAEDKAKVAKLIARVRENKTYAMAKSWAKESLTGDAYTYFTQEISVAEEADKASQ